MILLFNVIYVVGFSIFSLFNVDCSITNSISSVKSILVIFLSSSHISISEKYINEAEEIARSNNENSLFASENYNVMYLKMRREQCSALYDMYCYVKQMNITPKQAVIISDFLRKISEEYDESNTVSSLIEEADKIFEIMKLENLPEKREEFENRAILYSLLLKTREFLHIKYIFITRQLN